MANRRAMSWRAGGRWGACFAAAGAPQRSRGPQSRPPNPAPPDRRPPSIFDRVADHVLSVVVLALGIAATASANVPPDTPTITEPAEDGRVLNGEDVHMETGPFSDADPGDEHLCTDWEIWTVSPSERVWAALCATGLERLHIHLADGAFQGSQAGRTGLLPDRDYVLRVRHSDDSGDPVTRWSDYAQRLFSTGPATSVFPLELDDVATTPIPTLLDATGATVRLPAGPTPATIRLESATGDAVLELRGQDGMSNQVINPPPLGHHAAIRARVDAGASGAGLLLSECDLSFTDGAGVDRTVYLPALSLPDGQQAYYWISSNGSTYVGAAEQTTPDFGQLARGAAVPWTVLQPGYRVETVASGFQLPVNIAFVPEPGPAPGAPLFYVTELYGTIRVVRRDGQVGTYAAGLLNFNPTGDFPGSGEQGLTGICVDAPTGDVYASMLYSTNPSNDSAPHYPKVVRFTSGDGGLTAATQTTILDMVGESQGQSHQISNLTIGPDGKLYVHMGDGFSVSTAQNLNSFRGKILRVNLDGSAPGDNPFYNGPPITARDYVFALGFRNPFGGAWRTADGMHYEVENGPSRDRFAQVVAGRNYLWDGSDASMSNFAIYNWFPAHAPVNIAFVQPETFGGSSFPAEKQGHAFVTESGPTWATGPQSLGKQVVEFVLDAAGNVVSGPTALVRYNGSGKATCAGLAAGPDGLYFTDLYKDQNYQSPIDPGANVLRIKHVGAADFTADVTSGPRPLTVQFTDTSTVPNASAWNWQFGDGSTSTERNPTHTYVLDGVYDVRLTVAGSAGLAVTQRNGYIRVGNVYRFALIGGSASPTAADAAVANFLRGEGFLVDYFDDQPSGRPTAQQLAEIYNLVLVSSTIASANVAGEFRTVNVPLVFWENALLRIGREALMDGGAVVSGVSAANIINNTHPMMQGLPLGSTTVFSPGAVMSVGQGQLAAGAALLARRAGSASDAAILAAEQGAQLLGGYVAPARRVFVFFEDSSFLNATAAGRDLLRRAVRWAADVQFSCPADLDGNGAIDLNDLTILLAHYGTPGGAKPAHGDIDLDGDVDLGDLSLLLSAFGSTCR